LVDLTKKFTRRLVSYMYLCSPKERIAVADFLRERLKENNETNENSHLLEVPNRIRDQYK